MVFALVFTKLALKQAIRTGAEVAVVAVVGVVAAEVARDRAKQLLGIRRS